eukprot:6184629-Pleurochrysis_carterae.AAC.2
MRRYEPSFDSHTADGRLQGSAYATPPLPGIFELGMSGIKTHVGAPNVGRTRPLIRLQFRQRSKHRSLVGLFVLVVWLWSLLDVILVPCERSSSSTLKQRSTELVMHALRWQLQLAEEIRLNTLHTESQRAARAPAFPASTALVSTRSPKLLAVTNFQVHATPNRAPCLGGALSEEEIRTQPREGHVPVGFEGTQSMRGVWRPSYASFASRPPQLRVASTQSGRRRRRGRPS